MKSNKTKILCFGLIGIFSLFFGLLIYLLFRENTIVSKLFLQFVDLQIICNALAPIESNFLKYYFVDFLWALSLSCGLHLIFLPKTNGSVLCSVTVVVFGAIFEFFQTVGWVNGTGDALDVISYMLAAVAVNIINFKKGK